MAQRDVETGGGAEDVPAVISTAKAEATPATPASRQECVTNCYKMGDVSSLVKLHDEIDLDNVQMHDEDSAGIGSDYIKAFVFGGLDGIVSTFALVAGLGGAQVNLVTMIAVGVAKVFSDAFSMGFGEFTSASAELEHVLRLKAREEWELMNHEEGEVKEMCQIYMEKGVSKEDALTLMTIMAKYKSMFVDHMMVMEHGVMPPDSEDKWAPVKSGFVCFMAFFLFGLVPLFGFMVLYAMEGDSTRDMGKTMVIAYALTATTLFVMGFMKATLTGNPKRLKSGVMMVVNGTIAGGAAYLIGDLLAQAF